MNQQARKKTVLFLCTGNSCRSQMAEGWLRHLSGGNVEALSAWTKPMGVHPLAIRVMAEAGVEIACQRSKSIDEYMDIVPPSLSGPASPWFNGIRTRP